MMAVGEVILCLLSLVISNPCCLAQLLLDHPPQPGKPNHFLGTVLVLAITSTVNILVRIVLWRNKLTKFRSMRQPGEEILFSPKWMNFRSWGYFRSKCFIAILFALETAVLLMNFQKKLQYIFPKRGGGSGNFSENSSILEKRDFPKFCDKIAYVGGPSFHRTP